MSEWEQIVSEIEELDDIRAYDAAQQQRVIDSMWSLADDPRPSGCNKLSARPAWRIRVGSFRVITDPVAGQKGPLLELWKD